MVTKPLWLSVALCPSGSLSVYLTSLSLLFPFRILSSLTGCHHIFSQLPTTSYSATTDLNTDLALSVPLR